MYGTIARMRVKQGKEQEFAAIGKELETRRPAGMTVDIVYRSDAEPQIFYLAVVFESKEAYQANASSPEQNAQYLRYRALLEEEPEWQDGEVVYLRQSDMHGS